MSGVPRQPGAWLWLGGLGLLCLAMFFDVLSGVAPRVLGHPDADVVHQFIPWREFGFGELAKGNLALWNPHVFAGAPYFGGWQSALLYPPNWLFLVLPLPLALNWSVALNAWLLAVFMFWWGLRRGLHPFAAFVAAGLLMFSAPHFLRLPAGHLASLAAMAWAPLVFLAIDEWLRARSLRWCLLGMLAVAMQILAGHPQFVYYTALVAGGYAFLRLLAQREGRLVLAAGLAGIYAGAALLAAVQLLAGMQAASETLRDAALPFSFAATFGFPPENLLTLVAPTFFGDGVTRPYWGRWYFWETCAFVGVIGLALAAHGMAAAGTPGRRALLGMTAAAAVLALGASTPLFGVLFDTMPFFDRFRGATRFMFLAVLFLALFAGYGVDRLLREPAPRKALMTAGAAALALGGAAALVYAIDWRLLTATLLASGETYARPDQHVEAGFVEAAQAGAARALLLAALVLAAAATLAAWARAERRAVFLIGALAVAEVFAFARLHRPAFDGAPTAAREVRELLARDPGDYRILHFSYPNSALSTGALDLWGSDPFVTRRLAELMRWSEGGDPAQATQQMSFRHLHPLLSMLRVKYLVQTGRGGAVSIIPAADKPLRQLELVSAHRVRGDRAGVLQALGEPSFDPRREVILEREPDPAPAAAARPGRAAIARQGTDFLEIDVELTAAAVLLVTDAWAPSWRAIALEGSSAARYEVMPANYALRAVPLGPGKHRLRLEYAPPAFRAGAALSVVAWGAWLVAVLAVLRREGDVRRA
jgi:hypothetical protein